MNKEIRTETLSDGSVDFGNGVIGPSVVDIFVANNADGSLPTSPNLTRNTIFEVGALGASSVMVVACGAEAPATQNNATEAPVITVEPASPAPTAEITPSAKPAPETTVSPEPTATTEPTTTPEAIELPTAMEAAEQILNQAKSEIDETSLGSIEKKINKLWDEHGDVLKTVVLDGEKLSRKGMLDYINLMKKGMSKNVPIKLIIEERAGFSAGLSALELGAYDAVEEPEIKKMLLDSADDNFDYAMTSISSKSSDKTSIKKYFVRDLPYLLDFYLNS